MSFAAGEIAEKNGGMGKTAPLIAAGPHPLVLRSGTTPATTSPPRALTDGGAVVRLSRGDLGDCCVPDENRGL